MGHVHPLLPVMQTLQTRGHAVALATSRLYQERIEREGLPFYPLGPHYSEERLEEFFPPIRYLRIHYLRVSYDFLRIFMASIPRVSRNSGRSFKSSSPALLWPGR